MKVPGNDVEWFVARISLRPGRYAAYATSLSFVTKKKAFQTIGGNIFGKSLKCGAWVIG